MGLFCKDDGNPAIGRKDKVMKTKQEAIHSFANTLAASVICSAIDIAKVPVHSSTEQEDLIFLHGIILPIVNGDMDTGALLEKHNMQIGDLQNAIGDLRNDGDYRFDEHEKSIAKLLDDALKLATFEIEIDCHIENMGLNKVSDDAKEIVQSRKVDIVHQSLVSNAIVSAHDVIATKDTVAGSRLADHGEISIAALVYNI